MFFDQYPRFHGTSKTASSARRLNLRHRAMIEANSDILAGARVLDLASHDGRWSFAALQAGAAHVTGVEARHGLVKNANESFAEYDVPRDRYDFVHGDMFEVLARQELEADVVLCLGFMYHTLRYPDLLRGIKDARPEHLVVDTKVIVDDEPRVRLVVNRTGNQSNAAKDAVSHENMALAGWPSVPALHMMLDVYDFDVEKEYDWPGLLAERPEALPAVRDYGSGNRVTLRCRSRPSPP